MPRWRDKSRAKAKGRSIATMHLPIAPQAVHKRLAVVERNGKQFERIRQLNIQSWGAVFYLAATDINGAITVKPSPSN
jgi:predicted nucleic acid-binding protein